MEKNLNLSEIVLAIIIFAGLSLLVFISLNTDNQLKNVATSADVNKIAKSIDHLAISLQHPVATTPTHVSEPNAVVVDGNRPVSFNGNLTVKNIIKSCRGEITVRWNYCRIPAVKKAVKKVMISVPSTPIMSKASPVPVIVENKSYSEENSFNLSDYTPQMAGDYGTTFKMSGHPLYFLSAPYYKKLGYTIPPKWNGQYPMELSVDGGYWTYEDKTVTLDYNAMVNKVWVWCVWVGERTSGGSTYDMYLPHESIKPLLQAYLGREYGEISSNDLQILSRHSQGIADGTIRPNHVIENTARGYKDSHLYEGWEFCTKNQYVYHGIK